MARYLDESFLDGIFDVPQYKVSTEDCYGWLSQPWLTYDNYIKPNCIVKIEKETNKMEAKKCDRCGKLYETESANDMINVLFKQENISDSDRERYSEFHNNEMRKHDISIKRGHCSGQVDLCPECRESFKKWFEES
jgi:hypothetical protein